MGHELADDRADRRLRATLDSLLDPHVLLVAVRDDAGEVVDFEYAEANAAACEYNGMSRDELIGSRLLDLLPGHGSSGLFDQYCAVLASGRPLILDDAEYPPEFRGDGAVRHFDIRAVPVDDALSYTWRDVTDRHDEVAAVRLAEARYQALSEAATDVVLRIDAAGVIGWVSASMKFVLGWTDDEVLGRSLATFTRPEDERRLKELWPPTRQRNGEDPEPRSSRTLIRVRDRSGTWHPMSAFITADPAASMRSLRARSWVCGMSPIYWRRTSGPQLRRNSPIRP